MNKVTFTNAFINKGYEDGPVVVINDAGTMARFSICSAVYDKEAEKNRRYINFGVRALGSSMVERIKKLDIKAGDVVNLSGKLDINEWTKDNVKHKDTIIILDEIEFCAGKRKDNASQSAQTQTPATVPTNTTAQTQPPVRPPAAQTQANVSASQNMGGFAGFESPDVLPFPNDDANPFFTEV